MFEQPSADPTSAHHKRRQRYRGKNPRRFEEKYKELDPQRYGETVAKVLASGKTPAGMHRPVLVEEVLAALKPKPGGVAVDCTLGYGGHAQEILIRLQPGGRLIGLDADPLELPKTEARLRSLGFGPATLTIHRSNFAGIAQVLAQSELPGADMILADLGVSSMQIDNPARGFSVKHEGPLDMRMNPHRSQTAAGLLKRINPKDLVTLLEENADEPNAAILGPSLAGEHFSTTTALAAAIRAALPKMEEDASDLVIRRVFQALRIAVNDEYSALDAVLRALPGCLNPGGCAAIISFHSGEDRRVKKAFQSGLRDGIYASIAPEVIRPSAAECATNPRSASAKLRWARRAV